MSNFGKKYDPNKRQLNKILNARKKALELPRKRKKSTSSTLSRKSKKIPKIKFNSPSFWIIFFFMVCYILLGGGK